MFGGQTDGDPFLEDTWLYSKAGSSWREIEAQGPSARNLYAFGAHEKTNSAYLFGGEGEQGPLNDLWSFDGKAWEELRPDGTQPPTRSGIEFAVIGDAMLVFGGTSGNEDLSDLWQLKIP